MRNDQLLLSVVPVSVNVQNGSAPCQAEAQADKTNNICHPTKVH
jgi:hypothetical protein